MESFSADRVVEETWFFEIQATAAVDCLAERHNNIPAFNAASAQQFAVFVVASYQTADSIQWIIDWCKFFHNQAILMAKPLGVRRTRNGSPFAAAALKRR